MREDANTMDTAHDGQHLPAGVAGWSWGAFVFSWIWAIGNRTWWGLLGLVPGVGLVMRVVLGVKGREWAWRSRNWDSVDHFQRVQRRWSIAAGVCLGLVLLALVAALALPTHQHRPVRHAGEQLEL